MKVKYFQDGDRYIAVTNESPKDFQGVLFIGKSGTDPLKVTEGVFAPTDVLKLPEIAKADMPAVWMVAFGYERPVAPKKPPEPEYDEFPLFDPETNDLLDFIPVRRQRRQVLQFTPNRKPYDLGLIIGICIGLICIALGLL